MKKTKMTLSKEELEFALGCAKSYYYESSESDYPNKSDKINEIRYRDLENALCVDNLEIEGYEKVEWIKFDANDPKTYPPESGEYLVCLSDDGYTMPTSAAWFNDSQQFNVSLPVAYWRHKPFPPAKTEEKIDSEHVDYEEYKRLKKENEELRKRLESLEEKNCEQWIKFDRGNPDTYPPPSRHYIGYAPGGYITVMFRYSSEVETDEQFANQFSLRYGFTHWKPGPKAP